MTRRFALRTRLTLWFVGSILLIVTPFLVGVLVREWRSMRSALDHHLEEDLEVAVEMLVADGTGVRWRTASASDPGYDGGVQRWVEVYGADRRVLYTRGPAARLSAAGVLPPVPARSGFETVRTPGGAYVRLAAERRDLGGGPVWVRVARSEDGLRRDLQVLILIFSVGAPLAVLAAAVAGYIVSGRALAPLAQMTERAQMISADLLSERLPIVNRDDELGRLATVFNDLFARLEGSFERLRRFTADASHELRTPLTAIRSVGEVGLQETRTAGGYKEIIGSMLEEVGRLSRLVDTLLTLSRWESGRVRVASEQLNLRSLVDEVVAQLEVLAEDRDVRIVATLDGELPVRVDHTMVRQALMNVLDNAIKFSPPGGSVRVRVTPTATEYHLIVDDDGPGVPPEERPRIFERFYRIDRDRSDAGGSGLGLSIAYWAMTANGGRIVVGDSDAGGARVCLVFPRQS